MEIIFSQNTIEKATANLAKEIDYWYISLVSEEQPLVIVPILNGGMFFYVDLVRQLSVPNTLGVISTSNYANGSQPNKNFLVKFVDAEVKDKEVLLVDEICFTGTTLINTKSIFNSYGAQNVRSAVMVHHVKKDAATIPDFSALQYEGEAWMYGRGMDLKGLYRNKLDIVA